MAITELFLESTWYAVKQSLPRSGTVRSLYQSYFCEYMFHCKYFENVEDKFIPFLNQVKHVYTPSKKHPPLGDLTNTPPSKNCRHLGD